MTFTSPHRKELHGEDRERQLARLIRGKAEVASRDGDEEKHCPWRRYRSMLHQAGLRPTRQRMMLSWLLFARGNRHVTAEILYDEALATKMTMSLATIYNTLHQFAEAGLLRPIAVEATKLYFDTNPSEHHHFFVEGEQAVLDIPETELLLDQLPEPPPGFEIARVDVTVRLRRKTA